MTLSELWRAIESKKRIKKAEEQHKAVNDYILADLIGRSIARIYNASAKFPTINEVYPALFEAAQVEESISEQQDNLSAIRFRQFAKSFNKNYKEVARVE